MKLRALLGIVLFVAACSVGIAAQDKVEKANPEAIQKTPKEFEGKTVRLDDMLLNFDGVHSLDKNGELIGLTLNWDGKVYYHGNKLNKEGVTYVVTGDLKDSLRGFMDKNRLKLLSMNVNCKVEKKEAVWVAKLTQIEIWGVGPKKITPVILK